MNISSFRDELVRIMEKRAAASQKVVEFAAKKPLLAAAGLLGIGGVAHHEGSKALKDLKMGRSYRQQMEKSRR